MKTGIELIAQERKEQIEKHGRTIQQDVRLNNQGQLRTGASGLIANESPETAEGLWDVFRSIVPPGWDSDIWNKMYDKSYKERLIIAGALIAAEIDRLQNEVPEKE